MAITICANTDITSSDAPVSEGYRVLKEKVESVYSCMGISCIQVGPAQQLYSSVSVCASGPRELPTTVRAALLIEQSVKVLSQGLCFHAYMRSMLLSLVKKTSDANA